MQYKAVEKCNIYYQEECQTRNLATRQKTHTHTPVSRPFVQDYPGEPVPERYNQSGFYWSKRQWVAVAPAGPYASLYLAPDRQPCQHPTTRVFLQAGCSSCRPTNSVKALKAQHWRQRLPDKRRVKKSMKNCMQKWKESECQKHVIRKDVEISKCSLKFFVD